MVMKFFCLIQTKWTKSIALFLKNCALEKFCQAQKAFIYTFNRMKNEYHIQGVVLICTKLRS